MSLHAIYLICPSKTTLKENISFRMDLPVNTTAFTSIHYYCDHKMSAELSIDKLRFRDSNGRVYGLTFHLFYSKF